MLLEKYLVNFNCPLNNQENEKVWQLYFRHDLDDMYDYGPSAGDHDGLIFCLTNCGDTQAWENLGIDNIQENSWQTNSNHLYSGETNNPVLAAFPDGAYQLDVTCYAHDETVTFPESSENLSCELHNFSPALRKVSIIDLETDQTYYHAEWIPDGLSAELDVSPGIPAPAGAELQVILWFTESMTTGSLSASLGPLSIGNGEWSSSVVPNDTWAGEVTMPTDTGKGEYILSVSATDVVGLSLMNPDGIGSVPGSSTPDTHHSLSLSFGIDFEWSVTLPEPIRGSIAIADIDGDGYMELAVQTEEGTVYVYNHDGSLLAGWPRSNTAYLPTFENLLLTPALGDITGNGSVDVSAGYQWGNMAWNSGGTDLPGWPFEVTDQRLTGSYFAFSSPVLCNLDTDDALEIIACRQFDMYASTEIPQSVFAIDSDGSEIWSTNLNPANDGESVMGTPIVVDVTGDATPEVLVCTSSSPSLIGPPPDDRGINCNGKLYLLSGSTGNILYTSSIIGTHVYGSPVVGDIDNDPSLEVVIPCFVNVGGLVKAYVFSLPSLTLEHSWSLTGGPIGAKASPALGDINGDGIVDVIMSVSNEIFAWDGESKNPLAGFPVNVGNPVRHGVSLADIDGDDYLELVFCTENGYLRALNQDGSICGGFPIHIGNSFSQPAIDDIDGDGRLEICVANTLGEIIVYEAQESSWPAALPWSQYQHDARNSGILGSDFTFPAPPTDFEGEGELAGGFFTADLSWTLSVNDPDFEPIPTPPADVISYRIYRKIPPRPVELIATVSAGDSTYTDFINLISLFQVVAYSATAWDGVNESELTTWAKFPLYGSDNIAAGCPVREIIHSQAIAVSSTHSAITDGTSSTVDRVHRNGCRILTDGEYDAVYTPSGLSDCVEIDLGAVFTVNTVTLSRMNQSISGSLRYELSVDGRTFTDTDTGRARYIRVYSVAGTSEIEVFGSLSDESSSLIEIQRGVYGGYRIASVEAGSPLAVSVFDLSGRKVWNSTSSAGEVLWNRCSSSGSTVPAGVYLIMVESDDTATFTAKVVVR
ncbi:MAG: T9SS type A sorting domain-containing protein [Candidatus Sabulitectum sp.]|nr:T9SS type A sorting domain-containing protein [Candidatus Sabulitectum sp.]